MFIPIRTDYRMAHWPIVNYLIVAINVGLYIAGINGSGHAGHTVDQFLLQPDNPTIQQFFTSMFMHGSWAHLIGNMVFLWVFGNAVNDRLGHAGYLAFYLSGGLLAGTGYLLLSGNAPVLGASGAISAVTGAYLVLLPRARVTLLVWLFYLFIPLDVSSLYFLAFQFVWNVVMSFNQSITSTPGVSEGGVAYIAHSSGYIFGILVAAALLAARLLERSNYDLLSLVSTFWRRDQYRRMVAQGYNPFTGQVGGRHVSAKPVETAVPDAQVARELELRREISQALANHDLPGAAPRYLELIRLAPATVLSRQQQLDVANHFMSTEQHAQAADAYERFLKHYGGYEYIADIYLMLGLLHGRYLHQEKQAMEYLQRAVASLRDPKKIELAQADLEALRQGSDE